MTETNINSSNHTLPDQVLDNSISKRQVMDSNSMVHLQRLHRLGMDSTPVRSHCNPLPVI